MTSIVKVQRPIHTNEPEKFWLMYDKYRVNVTKVPDAVVPNYVKKAMGIDHKAYFIGAWSSVVGWGLSERVSDTQDF